LPDRDCADSNEKSKMSKVNEGMRKTDEALAELEKRIQKSYNEAGKEIETMLDDYFGQFKSDDEAMLEKVKAGALSETQYRSWRYGRMARGENYKALRDEIAKRLTNISSVAYSYINDTTPTIYTLNRNYAAYTIERMRGDSVFSLWDESTVRRLIKDQPDLMPNYPAQVAVKRGIDLAFGKKQITASVTSAVIQGKSIPNLASDLRKRITTMSASSAVRTARTAVTAAQNGGTLDTFLSAKEMGIPIKKEWLATLDARTRPAHGKADGQQVDVDEPFVLDGYKLMFPGDKSAPAYLVYNCRCTMVAVVDGVTDRGQRRGRVNGTGENVVLKDMTYSQWKASKSGTLPESYKGTALPKPESSKNECFGRLFREANARSIEYRGVELQATPMTQDEIIAVLGGGDMTGGSCASVALAYIGQRQGYTVLDFRGGESRSFFSRWSSLLTLAHSEGVRVIEADGKSSLTVGNRLLKQCEAGKEYYLAVGRHAAIVRKTNDGVLQYLELQSARRNGWTNFDKSPRRTLATRFGCNSASDVVAGKIYFMIDISESNFKTDDFRQLLGYLNTAKTEQKKGSYGTIK
jgi:SPP1 gp7 family putative phage head morphogenesis protein